MKTISRFIARHRTVASIHLTLAGSKDFLGTNMAQPWLREEAMNLLKLGRFNSSRLAMESATALKSAELATSAVKKIKLGLDSVSLLCLSPRSWQHATVCGAGLRARRMPSQSWWRGLINL